MSTLTAKQLNSNNKNPTFPITHTPLLHPQSKKTQKRPKKNKG